MTKIFISPEIYDELKKSNNISSFSKGLKEIIYEESRWIPDNFLREQIEAFLAQLDHAKTSFEVNKVIYALLSLEKKDDVSFIGLKRI